uniref:Large ribosomal subunit protein uL18c n=1 Tax=Alexandrium catenella TaxID=2925 RepID=A0A7S1LTU2_ALECA
MRSGLAAALAAAAALALCCRAAAQERRQPKWLSPAFVGAKSFGAAAPATVAPPPVAAWRSPQPQPHAGPQAPPSGAAFGRAAFAFAVLCAAAAARAAAPRVACNATRKFNYVDKWKQFKMPNMGYRISGAPGHPGSPHFWTEPIRWCQRFRRRIHIRRKVEGTCARPRLAVFRSLTHMHVNVVDDTVGTGVTLICATTKQKPVLEEIRQLQGVETGKESTWSEEAAEVLGREVAKRCLEKNITMVVFDRGGFPYEGRVKALAEAARSGGLQF